MYSAENDKDPGIVPPQLEGITQIEEMLIARVCPIISVYRKMVVRGVTKDMILTYPKIFKVFCIVCIHKHQIYVF